MPAIYTKLCIGMSIVLWKALLKYPLFSVQYHLLSIFLDHGHALEIILYCKSRTKYLQMILGNTIV